MGAAFKGFAFLKKKVMCAYYKKKSQPYKKPNCVRWSPDLTPSIPVIVSCPPMGI
jgi:hypothetical protein